MANTVAFGRGVTTLSTRDACVEHENMGRGFSLFGLHGMCVLN